MSLSKLCTAVSQADYLSVRSALRDGEDPDSFMPYKFPARWGDKFNEVPVLVVAVDKNQVDIINILLQNNATVDLRGDCPVTALYVAAALGFYNPTETLIKYRANVNARDLEYGALPIHAAAAYDDVQIGKLLISHGSPVDALNNYDATPLHYAAHYGKKHAAQWLVSIGADIKRGDVDGDTPADYATSQGHQELASWLQGCQANLTGALQGCQANLTGALQGCQANLTGALQGCQANLTGAPAGQANLTGAPAGQANLTGAPAGQVVAAYPNNKGRVIVYNFTEFDNPKVPNRTGAETDSETIKNTFSKFVRKYEVVICENYTSQETLQSFKNLQLDTSLNILDSLIIFISSHGKSRNIFYTRDGKININDLRSLLYETPQGCLNLKGIPKIFLANYCQGNALEESILMAQAESSELFPISERVESEGKLIAVPRNMKTFFSTSDGVFAWRHPNGGNYFIQTFCEVLNSNPKLELQQLIFLTNEKVEKELNFKSTFSEEGSRFNHFYF